MIYELLYLVPSRYSDTEIEGVTKSVKETLEKNGASVEKNDVLEKIKLAYPIKKDRYGTYVLAYFTVDGENLAKIDLDLKLMDELLRHVLVKREDGIPTEDFKLKEYEAPITSEGKRVHQAPRAEAKSQKPARKQAPVSGDDKMSMEELDKKLDDILDTDLGNV